MSDVTIAAAVLPPSLTSSSRSGQASSTSFPHSASLLNLRGRSRTMHESSSSLRKDKVSVRTISDDDDPDDDGGGSDEDGDSDNGDNDGDEDDDEGATKTASVASARVTSRLPIRANASTKGCEKKKKYRAGDTQDQG